MAIKTNSAVSPLIRMVLLALITLISLCACNQEQNRPAPKFTLQLFDTIDHASMQTRNFPNDTSKVSVVNFWFPSCPPCISEMPEINKFYLEHRERVEVIAVQLVGLDSVEAGQQFVTANNIAFAVGADLNGKITTDYKVSVFPSTFFISTSGDITKVWQGKITADEIKEIVTPMITRQEG